MTQTDQNQNARISPPPTVQPGRSQADPWSTMVLKLRPALTFETRQVSSDSTAVIIEDSVRSKFYQVGTHEFEIIAAFDGVRSVADIAAVSAGEEEAETALQRVKAVAQWLVQVNLAYSDALDNASRLDAQQQAIGKAKMIGMLNPISIKTKLFNPDRLLARLLPFCDWFFGKTVLAIWCLLAVVAIWVVSVEFSELQSASVGVFSGTRWLWMLLLWLGLKVIHELAHGIACKRYGGDVPEAGVLLLLFTPMAYVNVTSMWRFSNRWHRIVVAGAGMYVELLISFVALIVWHRSTGTIADVAFQVFLMASVTTVLFNANPLMRFDGYFILSDLLNVPNLYAKGTKWFADRLKALFFGTPRTRGLCPPDELRCVAIYGSLAFFWKISISVGLVIAASALFQGAGLVLALNGVVLWFGLPIARQVSRVFGPNAKHSINPWRTIVSCSASVFLVIGMFTFFRAPSIKSVPAIVQFNEETILRAGADGFVREILVSDGQAVFAGQPVVRLANPQLTLEVDQLRRQAEEARIQGRIHQQLQETSLSLAQTERYHSLVHQAEEKQKQADQLVVRAPFDGFVFKRQLENTLGSFAERGAPLLTLARRQQKEIIVSVDQRDLESLRKNAGEQVRVVMPGVKVFSSRLHRIDPAASSQPSHMALCAHMSGPLPVRPARAPDHSGDSAAMELLSPRVTAQLRLDSQQSNQLQSGQIGRAFFKARSQSLGSYLFLAASDWLENQFKQAAETAVF